jgi:hypothetical protein
MAKGEVVGGYYNNICMQNPVRYFSIKCEFAKYKIIQRVMSG